MKKLFTYKSWPELTEVQQKQVADKLAKLSKTEGLEYLKRPGMRYTIDENGKPTGGHQDPYILAAIF